MLLLGPDVARQKVRLVIQAILLHLQVISLQEIIFVCVCLCARVCVCVCVCMCLCVIDPRLFEMSGEKLNSRSKEILMIFI